MNDKVKSLLHHTPLGGILSMPFIYFLIVPFLLLDFCVTVYKHICFPFWGIETVRRADHVILDRKHLPFLNWRQKLNCLYCDYAQGVLAYVRAVTSSTEHFWCPVKHKTNLHNQTGSYDRYAEHEGTKDYPQHLQAKRAQCRACKTPGTPGTSCCQSPLA